MATPETDPLTDRAFADRSADEGRQVLVHAPYLVNPGSPTLATYERSLHLVAFTLGRAARIGAVGVVAHTGSAVTEGIRDRVLMRELLAHPAVAGLPVLLETPGGVDAYAEDLAVPEGLRT